MAEERCHTIYIVSDGTCRTCEQVVRAVLVQFKEPQVRLVRKPNVRLAQTVEAVMQAASDDHAVVFYTLVSAEARQAMREAVQRQMAPVVDVLGPIMGSLHDLFDNVPVAAPGMLYETNKEQFDRIDAVEYTLNHDDGRRVHELGDADVVLVGVSRSSKSTTCFFLAYRGIRAANVPLFADSEPAPELFAIDPRRIIGLQANPSRLLSVRRARLRGWGMNLTEDYADRIHVAKELRAGRELMEKNHWHCIDVSYKAVEEVAKEVIQRLHDVGVELQNRDRR
jgi:regulator of PEP synthase PpsR (kinase-PPPase family)